jgi:hypothetical protein
MKKLLTLTLLLSAPVYAAEAEHKESASTGAAPFSSLHASHPTFARLGQSAYDGLSGDGYWPAGASISQETALDTLRLLDRACAALASGTAKEQELAQSIDKTLQHGEAAVNTLIALDKDALLAKPDIRALKDRILMIAKTSCTATPTLSPEAIELVRKPLLEQIRVLEGQIGDLKKLREEERAEKLQLQAALIAMATGSKSAGAGAGAGDKAA